MELTDSGAYGFTDDSSDNEVELSATESVEPCTIEINGNQESVLEEDYDASLETITSEDDSNVLGASDSIYVSTEGKDESGYGTKSKPYKSLEYAINHSNSNSKIYVANGNYSGTNNRDITVNKILTICGNSRENTIIDAESLGRIFIMNSNAKLTLINLTLTNAFVTGDSDVYGGAIVNEGGQLTLINSTVKDSFGNTYGGAIYNNLGKLNIYNSSFINNSAMQYGGAIYTLGQNDIEFTNFTENFIIEEKGVGASVALGGTGYFNNCTFLKDHAIYSAAGILNLGNITINNCSFINLTTNYTGGALSNHNYALINNSYFGYIDVTFYAAAILAPPSGQHVKTEVYNTIFEFNHAGNHGVVSNNFKDCELLMKNCAITNNYIIMGVYYGDISLDDNATMNYCWWGQNEISPYYYSPHNENYESWKINASRWLVMDFTSNNGIIYQEKDNVLTVDIKQYFDNETKEICEYNEDINLPLTVTFYTEDGRVIRTMKLTNGSAQITYNPKTNVKAIYAKIDNQTLKIDVKDKEDSSIIAEDLTKIYKNDSQLEVKLVDGNNQALANKNITITIAGKTYKRITDENGSAKLNINLYGGTYNAVVEFKDDEDYRASTRNIKVNVLKDETSIMADDLVKYYKNSSQLVVKLVDKNNKAISNQKVIITLCNKDYSRITDENGMAKLNINLENKEYTAQIKFEGDRSYNASSKSVKINILKPQMTPLKTTLKNKKDQFTVTFKDANGNVIKNTKVKFVLDGKTYIQTTNNNGLAKLAISLKVGSYTVKTSFQSTATYGASTLTTKIKVV